jgi:hypothetical protein
VSAEINKNTTNKITSEFALFERIPLKLKLLIDRIGITYANSQPEMHIKIHILGELNGSCRLVLKYKEIKIENRIVFLIMPSALFNFLFGEALVDTL